MGNRKIYLNLQANQLVTKEYKHLHLFSATLIMYATISADIVSSTSLPVRSLIELKESVKDVLGLLERRFEGFWGRIVRGDTIECVMNRPEDAFEAAIILKCRIKSFRPSCDGNYSRFSKYGLRLAIGIGGMNIVNRELDMLDGEAIYRSGRLLDSLVGRSKYLMAISMGNNRFQEPLNIMLSLINHMLNNATSRRCLTLYERLFSSSSNETSERMGITISGVNQALNELGWSSIEQAILYYRKIMSGNDI